MYKIDCIILAAGKSTRMNMGLSKQFLEINGKPIIYYSLYKFLTHKYINRVILVLNPEQEKYCRERVIHRFFRDREKNIYVVYGGETRQDSVFNGLNHVISDYVLIHDGARPFVSYGCITKGIESAYRYGASSCYVPSKDTIKIRENENVYTLDRDKLLCIQTPQCFDKNLLINAYLKVKDGNYTITDETSALDIIGGFTYFYTGDYFNIKITTKEDLWFGESILNNILGED